jgi:hypothetical protein
MVSLDRYADAVYRIEDSDRLLDDVCKYMSKKRKYKKRMPASK